MRDALSFSYYTASSSCVGRPSWSTALCEAPTSCRIMRRIGGPLSPAALSFLSLPISFKSPLLGWPVPVVFDARGRFVSLNVRYSRHTTAISRFTRDGASSGDLGLEPRSPPYRVSLLASGALKVFAERLMARTFWGKDWRREPGIPLVVPGFLSLLFHLFSVSFNVFLFLLVVWKWFLSFNNHLYFCEVALS